MIGRGSLVRYIGNDGKFVYGQILFVHDRDGEKVIVYTERNSKGKWLTATVMLKDVEAVC